MDAAGEYVGAVKRKIEIAEYHLRRLEECSEPGAIEASIPVQAHFEGILYSAIGVTDQLAEAIRAATRITDRSRVDLDHVLRLLRDSPGSPAYVAEVQDWHDAPIMRDAREMRRRATHHHYGKTPQGPALVVEDAGKGYSGDRSLLAYSSAVVWHLTRVRPWLGLIAGANVREAAGRG